jgi:hypothetical protein
MTDPAEEGMGVVGDHPLSHETGKAFGARRGRDRARVEELGPAGSELGSVGGLGVDAAGELVHQLDYERRQDGPPRLQSVQAGPVFCQQTAG